MSPEDCLRTGLASLTFVLVLYIVVFREGRLPDDTQFWAVVLSLMLVAVLAADGDRVAGHVSRWQSRELFAQQITDLQNLPWQAYDVVAPGLEKIAGMIRGDEGGASAKTTVLKEADYGGALDADSLGATPGKETFKAMKLEYKQIVFLLCRMKSIAPIAHDTLITAVGAC